MKVQEHVLFNHTSYVLVTVHVSVYIDLYLDRIFYFSDYIYTEGLQCFVYIEYSA